MASANFMHMDPSDEWRKEIQKYQETKTSFQGYAEPYVKRTHKEIKEKETLYNPITQKFNDPSYEQQLQKAEKTNFVEVLA